MAPVKPCEICGSTDPIAHWYHPNDDDDEPQAGGPAMSLEEVLALDRKRLADAKAEGRREAITEAVEAVAEWQDKHCDGVDLQLLHLLEALLPPAPGEGGESGKVGG